MGAPTQTGTLADFETLLTDSGVSVLRDRLAKDFPALPDDFELATYIQPSKLVPGPGGILRYTGERAFFLIVSPNPHPRHKGELLKSFIHMRLDDWRQEEEERWRYAGKGDPAYKFFRGLARQHINAVRDWTEMN